MRGLQTKQPPAFRFTYNPSPPRTQPIQQLYSLTRNISPPRQSFQSTVQPVIRAGESSHIKVVDHEEMRSRRRRIFEEVGAAVRSSKSRERNRSFSIFNGAKQNTNKVKELDMSKESCKEQSVQTDLRNNTISNFQQPARAAPSLPDPVLKIDFPRPAPLPHEHDYTHSPHPVEADMLQRELSLKEKELAYLKLQLERQQRCQRINYENQSIYKRLVDKLDHINAQSAINSLQRTKKQKSKSKSPQRASPNRTRRDQSPTDTTRFLHPASTNRGNRKELLPNALNQPQTDYSAPHPSVLRSEMVRPSTVTFYRQDPRRNMKGHRATLQPPMPSDEELRENLQQSVRRYTNTVSYDEVPLKDKLSCMNRHLENKYTLREHSRPVSHSRYTQRGRSSSGPIPRSHLFL